MSDAPAAPALLVLAAGLGTRFGGDKQTTPLGPGGATLMEYTIYDALQAGFGRVVAVVRAEMQGAMQASLDRWLNGRVRATCVVQERDPARAKPWGTAHAVLAARAEVRETFAVVNADDIYGRAPFAVLAEYLRGASAGAEYALVGFALRDTLSEAGAVNRALCEADGDGLLVRITERAGVTRAAAEREGILDVPASMNFWGFTPAVFAQLEQGFTAFRREHGGDGGAEYLLPTAIQSLITAGQARVRLLSAAGAWCGVTYAGDAPRVSADLTARVARGEYPRELWS